MAYMRARANEFNDRDRNSAYFHHKSNSKRWCNHIHGLENEAAKWKSAPKDIEYIITHIFGGYLT